MTRCEYVQLKEGDLVEFIKGPDAGKVMEVIYIEDYHNICLKGNFAPTCSNCKRDNVKLKVTTGVGIVKI